MRNKVIKFLISKIMDPKSMYYFWRGLLTPLLDKDLQRDTSLAIAEFCHLKDISPAITDIFVVPGEAYIYIQDPGELIGSYGKGIRNLELCLKPFKLKPRIIEDRTSPIKIMNDHRKTITVQDWGKLGL
jgi:hypothetical protein